MKKKLSLGLVLALTLMLVVIGALAAVILTHKQFVEQVLSPRASENSSEIWTREEMDQILRIASDYGVTLDENALVRLSRDDVNYKEETMRLFAKAELGYYPSTWSIEDQAWYDQVLVGSGLSKQRTRFVPEGDEISQLKALDIALDYIKSNYDANASVTDTSIYRRHMTYQSYSDNPYNKGKQWYIEYEPLDQIHSHYTVILLSDGTVKEAKRELGLLEEGKPALTPGEVIDLFRDTYGDHTDWSMETWIKFQDALAISVQTYGAGQSGSTNSILRQSYALPDVTSISRETAINTARAAITESGGPGDKELQDGHESYAIYLLNGDMPVWKVSFFCQNRDCGVSAHTAEVDAHSGKVLNTGAVEYSEPWYTPYVLASLRPKTQQPEATSTPRPDGMPKIWRSLIAPDYYWDALDAIGYNSDTAADLYGNWQNEYGVDTMFWPLEMQAIDGIWHNASESTDVIPGLPGPGDITQEKALEIAWQSFREAKAQTYDDNYMDQLKTAVSFTFNVQNTGSHVWFIRFVEVSPTQSNVVGGVTINAATGEIMGNSQDGEIFLTADCDPSSPMYTPRPDGKPGVWYSDLAPAYFWEALDATGYNRENAAEFQHQWAKDYGEDKEFWPLTAKALETLWHFYDGSLSIIPGLPDKDDMTQEEAIALARETMVKSLSFKYDSSFLNSLTPAVSFEFNSANMGDHVWFIMFCEIKPSGKSPIGFVTINAKTGEVLNAPDGISHG